MSQIAIRAEQIGKRFWLDSGVAHDRFSELLQDTAGRVIRPGFLRRKSQRDETGSSREFWALRDISFDVQPGEVVGIIGRNGAGKSTLLRILTRITHPTQGRVEICGRVGSLLEVGTGFHPELTGRENIFLNGAILGMSRREIQRKLDDIVGFSEVESFLDIPVKRYSSGMTVRLAFAVAAHLEPEILIVDEVLAVGDIAFQKKCLGKMEEVGREGRTVLIVSHNESAISALCTRCLLLESGRLAYDGDVGAVLAIYTQRAGTTDQHEWTGAAGDKFITLRSATIRPLTSEGAFDTAAPLEIRAEATVHRPIEGLVFGFRLFSEHGYELAYSLRDDRESGPPPTANPGPIVGRWIIPGNTLASGRYRISWDIAIAWQKVCVPVTAGQLEFTLHNVSGLGRRYPVQNTRGFNSLFRPDWSVSGSGSATGR